MIDVHLRARGIFLKIFVTKKNEVRERFAKISGQGRAAGVARSVRKPPDAVAVRDVVVHLPSCRVNLPEPSGAQSAAGRQLFVYGR